jgi:hypothetical protein
MVQTKTALSLIRQAFELASSEGDRSTHQESLTTEKNIPRVLSLTSGDS